MITKKKVKVEVKNNDQDKNFFAPELKSFPRLVRKVKVNNDSKEESGS